MENRKIMKWYDKLFRDENFQVWILNTLNTIKGVFRDYITHFFRSCIWGRPSSVDHYLANTVTSLRSLRQNEARWLVQWLWKDFMLCSIARMSKWVLLPPRVEVNFLKKETFVVKTRMNFIENKPLRYVCETKSRRQKFGASVKWLSSKKSDAFKR